jgi:hypothetical protein
MVHTETGEFTEKTLSHEGNAVREFYGALEGPVVVGIEATGAMQWFLELLEELSIECRVGHPAKIRAAETLHSRPRSNTEPQIRLRVVTVLCNVGFLPCLTSSANSTISHAAAKMASSPCSCQNSMSNVRSGNPPSTRRVLQFES